MTIDKPPHSVEAELGFLASLVVDNSAIGEASKIVSIDAIWKEEHRAIYKAILDHRDGLDLVTLKDSLSLSGSSVSPDYLYDMVAGLPTASHWPDYAKSINDHARRREILNLSKAISHKTLSGIELNGELNELANLLKRTDPGSILQAEPAIDLMSAKIAPPDYIIEPLATVGRLTLLQGEPKGGKSCFSLLAAIAGSLGSWPFGRWTASGRPRNTVFVTYEDDRSLIQERLKQYTLGMAEPFQSPPKLENLFVYCDDSAPLILLETLEGSATLRKIIEDHKAEFVVVDTFSHLTAADENLKKEMQPVMNSLNSIARETHCAILVIHHSGKPQKDSGKSMVYRSRGSSAIPAGFVAILDWGTNNANLTQCRFIDKRGHKDSFTVEYIPEGDDVVRWKLVDSEDDSSKYGSRKAIIEALSTLMESHPDGATRSDVSKETKLSKNTVTTHLETLAKEGSIQARQIVREKGGSPVWFYAPITHQFPPPKMGLI